MEGHGVEDGSEQQQLEQQQQSVPAAASRRSYASALLGPALTTLHVSVHDTSASSPRPAATPPLPLRILSQQMSLEEEMLMCTVCQMSLDGSNGPADLRLSCGCVLHYTCCVQHIRNEMQDKSRLLAKVAAGGGGGGVGGGGGGGTGTISEDEARKGIPCPNAVAGGTCAFAGGGGGGVEGGKEGGCFISLVDMHVLLSLHDRIATSPRAQSAFAEAASEEQVDPSELFLTQAEVDKLRDWLSTHPLSPRSPGWLTRDPSCELDPYLKATSKPCPRPGCGARGTHYQGHHCHHVSPSCPTCLAEYCWACDATAEQNEELRGEDYKCACRRANWNLGCAPLRSAADIAAYLVLTPYPHDSRCGCPICPDCKEGSPCDRCGSPDGSDWNCAVCAGFILPGPRELDPAWAPQTEEMKAKSAIEPAPESEDQEAFFDAIDNDEEETVRQWVASGSIDINFVSLRLNGFTPLLMAIDLGKISMANLLLQLGASVLTCSSRGHSPSFMATQEGHLDTLRNILALGGDVLAVTDCEEGPIHIGAYVNRHECLLELLKHGAAALINSPNTNGETPLFLASSNGALEYAKLLIANGANVNCIKPEDNYTPAYEAAAKGHANVLSELIANGADIELCSNQGATACYIAAYCGKAECLRLLIAQGCNLEAPNVNGVAALFATCQNGESECTSLLVAAGANVNAANELGATPAFMASQRGNVDCLRWLMLANADLNVREQLRGFTPLDTAVQGEWVECLQLLIDSGRVHLDAPAADGITPLQRALSRENIECIEMLLKAGAIDQDAKVQLRLDELKEEAKNNPPRARRRPRRGPPTRDDSRYEERQLVGTVECLGPIGGPIDCRMN